MAITVKEFERQIRTEFAKLDYLDSQNINIIDSNQDFLIGEAYLQKKYYLKFEYKRMLYTFSFALIYELKEENDKRIWGLDKDNRIGWHLHPIHEIEKHEPIPEQTVEQIIFLFDQAWQKVLQKLD